MTAFAFLAGVGTFGPVSAAGGGTVDDQTRMASSEVTVNRAKAARESAPTPSATPKAAEKRLTGTGLSAEPSDDGSQDVVAVPDGSGDGRRVVFDISAQRVWLVQDDETVEKSYLVSGSVTDNLSPGSYSVYSRSRYAHGIDDSGTMQYFVRFTRGDNAAIGFHDIPVNDGQPLQTESQLGTPQSHGCIRQARPDAIMLWDFAPIGTAVDVVA